MVSKFAYLIISLIILSCGLPYDRLNRGLGTKVPKSNFIFINKEKFEDSIFVSIHKEYFYELENIFWSDKDFNIVKKGESDSLWVSILQFYPNGNVRRFPKEMMSPYPEIIGNRGVIYNDNGNIKIDFFEAISNNRMTIQTYKVKIDGDRLYLLRYSLMDSFSNNMRCYVFTRKEIIPSEYTKLQANW